MLFKARNVIKDSKCRHQPLFVVVVVCPRFHLLRHRPDCRRRCTGVHAHLLKQGLRRVGQQNNIRDRENEEKPGREGGTGDACVKFKKASGGGSQYLLPFPASPSRPYVRAFPGELLNASLPAHASFAVPSRRTARGPDCDTAHDCETSARCHTGVRCDSSLSRAVSHPRAVSQGLGARRGAAGA